MSSFLPSIHLRYILLSFLTVVLWFHSRRRCRRAQTCCVGALSSPSSGSSQAPIALPCNYCLSATILLVTNINVQLVKQIIMLIIPGLNNRNLKEFFSKIKEFLRNI